MLRILRVIHRIAGIIGSLLVLIMAITGILLNHRSLIGYNSDTAMKMQMFLFSLHSGALGNISIIWLTDLGAICMVTLSITGIWMWFKTKHHTKL
ncbi:hypothetical protein AB1283_17755 [Bacillus sp. S13(2024)]|uniref:hypothetical protein n=1 Tax=unclassified Bacillus (in: firmicutes) TaxID=185979 RepID=UPI003D209291